MRVRRIMRCLLQNKAGAGHLTRDIDHLHPLIICRMSDIQTKIKKPLLGHEINRTCLPCMIRTLGLCAERKPRLVRNTNPKSLRQTFISTMIFLQILSMAGNKIGRSSAKVSPYGRYENSDIHSSPVEN